MAGLQQKKYQTQWATQFYASAELTRRDYLVSLTFGNAPVADILAVSPGGWHFMVDMKGQASRNFWLFQDVKPRDDLYYILVYLPKNEPPRFFIMSSFEKVKKIKEHEKAVKARGRIYKPYARGFNFSVALEYENQWHKLPQ